MLKHTERGAKMEEMKFIKRLLVLVLVGLLFVAYGHYLRNEVIKSAELVEVTEDGYIISYDGEAHIYIK